MLALSLIITFLLTALGAAVKFTTLFPPAVVAWMGAVLGVGGIFAAQLVPPVYALPIPPRVMHILSQVLTSTVAALGVFIPLATTLPGLPPSTAQWAMLVSMWLSAFGVALVQHSPKPVETLADSAAAIARSSTPIIPFALLLAFGCASCATPGGIAFKQTFNTCEDAVKSDQAQAAGDIVTDTFVGCVGDSKTCGAQAEKNLLAEGIVPTLELLKCFGLASLAAIEAAIHTDPSAPTPKAAPAGSVPSGHTLLLAKLKQKTPEELQAVRAKLVAWKGSL